MPSFLGEGTLPLVKDTVWRNGEKLIELGALMIGVLAGDARATEDSSPRATEDGDVRVPDGV